MNVLVVSKKTNLELHGEIIRKRVQSGQIDPGYFQLLESTHDEHYRCLNELYILLKRYKIDYAIINRGFFWPDLDEVSAVITVGGDGTVLEASHHILDSRPLLVGVRSSSTSVGKLCHCALDGLESMVQQLAAHTLQPLLVSRLRACVLSADSGKVKETEPVLNDFLYANASPAATTRYKINFENRQEEHRSSGAWVSTACGSTAAIHAAGAKPMELTSPICQFKVRELYDSTSKDPHQTLDLGAFDPDTQSLQIENLSEKAILACDGLHGIMRLGFGDRVHFERGPNLRLAPPSFYQNSLAVLP